MARKLKITPRKQQPGLFDQTDNIFSGTISPRSPSASDDIMPKSDFTVNWRPGHTTTDTTESGSLLPIEVDTLDLTVHDIISFMSFGSGSSGNCSYIGDNDGGFLIDAGIDPGFIRDALHTNGLNFDKIKGICLTHDHSDHVRYVYSLVRKHPHIGVYCTPKTLSGILRRHNISRRIKDYHRPIYKEFAFRIGNFEITAFEVSHDGSDNSGFFITHGQHTFAIATDLGCITDRVDYYMRQANYIMIESNYDITMLQNGPYPMHLKARIEADNGHLDNVVTGRFLSSILSPRLTHIFLCHLSQDNNTPETALTTVKQALKAAGADRIGDGAGSIEARSCPIQLVALPRFEASPLYNLRIPEKP